MLGFRTVSMEDSDYYALKLISNILGKGMSSRLFDIIRTKHALAYYMFADQESYTDTGALIAGAGASHENAQKVVDLILKEFDDIKKHSVKKTELQKAKDAIRGNMAISMDNVIENAEIYGIWYLLTGKQFNIEELFAKYNKVTIDDCKRVANKYFYKNKLNIALVGKGKVKL